MADTDKNKNPVVSSEESVDDILAGIFNPDGTFNESFNGLFAKYVGGGQPVTIVHTVDISDRSDEIKPAERVEYDSGEISLPREKTADERIEEKLPQGIREVYADTSGDAQRPEFTASGDVRYPTMGTGASEERVVYDADWEEKAKQEAARRERVRRDRMLRGDSAYARTFVAGGMHMPQRTPYFDDAASVGSLYVDPLSRDSDFESADNNSEFYSGARKSFFPEGFSVAPKSSSAAGGKTENYYSSRQNPVSAIGGNPLRAPQQPTADWLRVEEKQDKKKKRSFLGKRKGSEEPVQEKIADPVGGTAFTGQTQPEAVAPVQNKVIASYAQEELSEVREEAEGLRSTVAEIVDKYKRRSEEEARRKLEEEARQEELRREEELRARRRLEELRVLKKDMSPELCEAIDSEEEKSSFDEYDDFSTVEPESSEKPSDMAYGVVFDPTAIDGADYTERLFENGDSEAAPETENEAAHMAEKKNNKKKKSRKKGRKDS